VLDLDTGVDLDEVVLVTLDEEFGGTGVAFQHCQCRSSRGQGKRGGG
jgi:hypothetical protein